MCQGSCNCTCKSKSTIPVLQVGKIFTTHGGKKATILAMTSKGWFLGEFENGEVSQWLVDGTSRYGGVPCLVKEYKEPVVHRRDVVWYRYNNKSPIHATIISVGNLLAKGVEVIHRQTVEYVE